MEATVPTVQVTPPARSAGNCRLISRGVTSGQAPSITTASRWRASARAESVGMGPPGSRPLHQRVQGVAQGIAQEVEGEERGGDGDRRGNEDVRVRLDGGDALRDHEP